MLDLNELNVPIDEYMESDSQCVMRYYRLNLRKLSPKSRAQLYYWETHEREYPNIYTSDDLVKIESGKLPKRMQVNLNNYN